MTVRDQYRIQTVERLLLDIRSTMDGGTRSGNRSTLADVYEMTLAAESFFPSKPLALRRSLPVVLRKRVSKTCSSCIHPDEMEVYVHEAKTVLKSYSKDLEVWLKDRDADPGTTDELPSVHELQPTIKKDYGN